MADTSTAGVVLAGGYSTRFGDVDKALAEVKGDPMLTRVVARLGEAVDTVVVNCRADQLEAFQRALPECETCPSVQFALDDVPDRGPLAGIRDTFEGIQAEYTAVVACDMPALDPDFLAYLFERAMGRDGSVPELPDGYLQPTQAVYRTDQMEATARQQLAAGEHSLRSALENLDIVRVSPAEIRTQTDLQTLSDANTKDELDALERN